MSVKFLLLLAVTLLACSNEVTVDQSKKIGIENGKNIYQVETGSIDVPRSRYAKIAEQNIIKAYCGELGGTILNIGDAREAGNIQKPLPGGGMYSAKTYKYDIKFKCT